MTKKDLYLSVVSPVYQSNTIVDELVKRIKENITSVTNNFEIILIDDGSTDNSWEKIKKNCEQDFRIKGIKLSRNFGQHQAISAGIKITRGDYAIVMDCDLQHDPIYIKDLVSKAQEGFDVVFTLELNKKKSTIRKITSSFFYSIFNYFSNFKNVDHRIGNYSLISRKVINCYNSSKEYHRQYLMLLRNFGFSSAILSINHNKRFKGQSSYNFTSLIKLAIDGITSNSDILLRKMVAVGFIYIIFTIIYSIYALSTYFLKGSYPGFTSIIIVLLSSTGLILSSLGIIGTYIGKIFIQVKNRPLYIIDKVENIES